MFLKTNWIIFQHRVPGGDLGVRLQVLRGLPYEAAAPEGNSEGE